MAEIVAVGDVFEVTYVGDLFGQTILNLFHYKIDSLGTTTDYVAFITDLQGEIESGAGNLYDSFLDCLSNDYAVVQMRVQKIFPIRLSAAAFIPAALTGTVANGALPPGTSGSIQRTGIQAGRHNIGGIRLAALPSTFVNDAELSNAGKAAYSVLAATFPNDIISVTLGTIRPIILNRAQPALSPDLWGASIKTSIRTMSRRVVGRGI